MRVIQTDIHRLREAIEPLDTDLRRRQYKAVGHGAKRYRWDLFWRAGSLELLTADEDYNDNHIDTALRHVVPDTAGLVSSRRTPED